MAVMEFAKFILTPAKMRKKQNPSSLILGKGPGERAGPESDIFVYGQFAACHIDRATLDDYREVATQAFCQTVVKSYRGNAAHGLLMRWATRGDSLRWRIVETEAEKRSRRFDFNPGNPTFDVLKGDVDGSETTDVQR
jgi:hypothetical protein